jgi:hypothetical protein
VDPEQQANEWLAPANPDPRDWKVKVNDDEGMASDSRYRIFQLEISEARRVAEKVLAACDVVQGIPSRPFG